jgi:F-type H+-transporting ATPase subunit a
MGRSAADTPTPPPKPAPRWRSARLWCAALAILLAASLVALNTSAGSEPADKEPQKEGEAKNHDGEHHEPSALEHVQDEVKVELFQSFGPPAVRLWPEKWKKSWFRLTKYKVFVLLAALIVLLVYVPVAKRVHSGEPPKGWWDNCFESVLTFLRDRVAKPTIGEEDADRYVPFLWTLFLFILVSNLLGLLPFGGSPTADISVTLALAICVFFAIHGAAIAKMGLGHYIGSFWPHLELPLVMKVVIAPLVFVLEVMGVLVRNLVLAVRLFANMFAGHTVMVTILLFIYFTYQAGVPAALQATVTFSSVVGVVLLSLLELFVAFLQAFIFVFLTSLFMGLALHPHH